MPDRPESDDARRPQDPEASASTKQPEGSRRGRGGRRLEVEALEQRILLSASWADAEAGAAAEAAAELDTSQTEAAVLETSDGNDTVKGGEGNDLFAGQRGNDRLFGGEGDDTLFGGHHRDTLDGGQGDDRLFGGRGHDTLRGGDGDDLLAGGRDDDDLRGGDGDDRLLGERGRDTLDGGAGDDTLSGGDQDDRLTGGDGNDRLEGDRGRDTLRGGAGDDVLDGGRDRDHLFGGAGADTLVGGHGGDRLRGEAGDDTLLGGEGNDKLYGGAGSDVLRGEAGRDRLHGNDGDDVLEGGGHHDWLHGGAGQDRLDGGDGNDQLRGGDGDDRLDGGSGNDRLHGESGNDRLAGGEGRDTLDGGSGNDVLEGGAGDDRLFGRSGDDHLSGGAGNDNLRGDAGRDTLVAGSGNDHVRGGSGDDVLLGQEGRDRLYGEQGADRIEGGAGDDRIYGGNQDDVLLGGEGRDDIRGGDHDDHIEGGTGNDRLYGNNGDDRVLGGEGDDRLDGGHGHDVLVGGAGNDQLLGRGGDDVLMGGAGDDYLHGGGGTDTVSYADAESGVRVDLTQRGVQDTGGGGRDRLVHVERVVGSAHDDVFAFAHPSNRATYGVDGGAGGHDVVDLSRYRSDQVRFSHMEDGRPAPEGEVRVEWAKHRYFTVEYSHIDEFRLADADLAAVPEVPEVVVEDVKGVEDGGLIPLGRDSGLAALDGAEGLGAVTIRGLPEGSTLLDLAPPEPIPVEDLSLPISRDGVVEVTFVSEGAGYRNTLGMYQIDPGTGEISDVRMVFENASARGSGGELVPGESSARVEVEGGRQLGFFLLADGFSQNDFGALGEGRLELVAEDGSVASVESENPRLVHVSEDGTRTQLRGNLFHSAANGEHRQLNPDGIAHLRASVAPGNGQVEFSFEDLLRGGDRDFDDVRFRAQVGVLDAHAAAGLDPSEGITRNPDGSFTVEADALAGLSLALPPDWSGSTEVEVEPHTTGGAAAPDAAGAFTLHVAGVADAPVVTSPGATGAEDTAIPLDVRAAVTHADGSERIASIRIAGLPEGAELVNRATEPVPVEDLSLPIERDGAVQVTFLGEEAGFRNSFGAYEIDPATGAISDVRLIWDNASAERSGGDLVRGESRALLDVREGTQLGFFLVANGASQNDFGSLGEGTFSFRDADGGAATLGSASPRLVHVAADGSETVLRGHVYHSAAHGEHLGLNPDGINHLRSTVDARTGVVEFGIEDLRGGGDRDFDDIRFRVDLGVRNAQGALGGDPSEGITRNPDGSYQVSPAVLDQLAIVPPEHWSGDIDLAVTATSVEAEGGDRAETTETVRVSVTPVADAPTLELGDVSGREDEPVALDLESLRVDRDGSETLSVRIEGVPEGGALSAGERLPDGSWRLTGAELEGLTLTPAEHSDRDLTLRVTATSTETANGDAASTVGTLRVRIDAVADAPVLEARDAVGREDAPIPLEVKAGLVDADGSEALRVVRISGVPEGARLSAGTAVGDGVWELEPGALEGLALIPVADSDRDFDLRVEAVSREGAGGSEAVSRTDLHVRVEAVADAPELEAAAASGLEDTVIPLDIRAAVADADGSERISSVRIEGLPEGAELVNQAPEPAPLADLSLIFPQDGVAKVTFLGEEAGYRNSLGVYEIDPATGAISDVRLVFENASAERSGGNLVRGESHALVDVGEGRQLGFFLVADGARQNDFGALGDGDFFFRDAEGGPATLASTSPQLIHVAPDGTETVLRGHVYHSAARGEHVGLNADRIDHLGVVPDESLGGARFGFEDLRGGGDRDFDDVRFRVEVGVRDAGGGIAGSPSQGITRNPDGSYQVSPEALDQLAIVPPEHWSGDIELAVTATSEEASGGDRASTTAPLRVVVTPVADAPELEVGGRGGDTALEVRATATEEAGGDRADVEDVLRIDAEPGETVPLPIDARLVDRDGSEVLTLEIHGVPEDATLSAGERGEDRVWRLVPADLEGLTLTTPPELGDDLALEVTADGAPVSQFLVNVVSAGLPDPDALEAFLARSADEPETAPPPASGIPTLPPGAEARDGDERLDGLVQQTLARAELDPEGLGALELVSRDLTEPQAGARPADARQLQSGSEASGGFLDVFEPLPLGDLDARGVAGPVWQPDPAELAARDGTFAAAIWGLFRGLGGVRTRDLDESSEAAAQDRGRDISRLR